MKYTIKELIKELNKAEDKDRNVFIENQDGVTDNLVISFDDYGDVTFYESV